MHLPLYYEIKLTVPKTGGDSFFLSQLLKLANCQIWAKKEIVGQLMQQRWPEIYETYLKICDTERRSLSGEERYSFLLQILNGSIPSHVFSGLKDVGDCRNLVDMLLFLTQDDVNLKRIILTDYGLVGPN